MSRTEMVLKVAHERGFEDMYTLKIGRYAEDTSVSDKEVKQMMYDILLGIGYNVEQNKQNKT